jgi:hypothetical protein
LSDFRGLDRILAGLFEFSIFSTFLTFKNFKEGANFRQEGIDEFLER